MISNDNGRDIIKDFSDDDYLICVFYVFKNIFILVRLNWEK